MRVEQLFTGCLAEMAYYISDNGEAAVIDPLRETEPYLNLAAEDNAKIKWIFLTHFHADFVSGQVDLAKKTGATIVFGPGATAAYDIKQGKDGELFPVGNINLKLLHTPGHTMESISLLFVNEKGETPYLFSGDALFIGDVGRPDLAIKQGEITQKDLAGFLFESLRNKIMPLPDSTIVYPNHGAGSACGKNMSKETFDTLGNQKKVNYALRADMTKDEFVTEVTTGLKTPPQYFPKNAGMNKKVNKSIDDILAKGTTALSAREFNTLAEQDDILVLDARSKAAFTKDFIPGSWYIGIDGNFAPWVGALITNIEQKIIVLSTRGKEKEVVTRLARVGYDNTLGYLKGGIRSWKAAGFPVDKIGSYSAEEALEAFKDGKINLVDVRKESEFFSQRVEKVTNFPLDFINTNFSEIKSDKEYTLHCASGYRSLIAASIFKANGVSNVSDVRGGFNAMKRAGAKLTDYVCPTTML